MDDITIKDVSGRPKVSVLLPSFNYARYLPSAIQSVLAQTYRNVEVIITDDCSTDGSREIAEQWAAQDQRIRVVTHDKNRGLSAARNSGLAASSGEYIALCDADDMWLPEKLAAQLACFAERPEVGLVHSDGVLIDSSGRPIGARFSDTFHQRRQKTSGRLLEELCRRNFLCVPTVVMRREAIESAGGFDERLRSLEDWVCWTLIAKNYSFVYIERPLVNYRVHDGSLSSQKDGMARNRVAALRLLLEATPEIPARIRGHMLYNLGMSHLELGETSAAFDGFRESVRTNMFELRSWVRLLQSLVRGGD